MRHKFRKLYYQEQPELRLVAHQKQLAATGTFQYVAAKFLNLWFNGAAYSFPGTIYLGQDTGTPTATAAQYEVSSSNGYTRLAVVCSTVVFGTISATNVMTSTATVSMATATGAWTGNGGTNTTCKNGVFNDTSGTSGGNWLFWGLNGTAETVVINDVLQYTTGNMTITLN